MKRLWVGMFMMVIVVSACIWGTATMNTIYSKLSEPLEQILSYAQKEDYENCEIWAQKLEQAADKYNTRLFMLKHHDKIDELLVEVYTIPEQVKRKDKELLINSCEEALVRLENVYEGERVIWGNIF